MTQVARLAAGLVVLALLGGCGSEKRQGRPLIATVGAMAIATVAEMGDRGSGDGQSAKAGPTRADLEEAGTPLLAGSIPAFGLSAFLTILDSRDDVVTWKTRDGRTFALRDGVLIQTRGLGPDLMSSVAPTVGQLMQDGGAHQRQYFFLGPNDQPTRRTYECTVVQAAPEEIVIVERTHQVTRITETCTRPQSGPVTNEFWIEGETIRKSRQWVSAMAGYMEFERVVD